MRTTRYRRNASVALLAFSMAGGLAARADDRPAEKILTEIRDVKMPQIAAVDRGNRQAIQEFMTKRQAVMERKAELIGELYKQHPDNPELVQLMPERWQALMATPKSAGQARTEINNVIAAGKNEKLANEAAYLNVLIGFREAGRNLKADDLMPSIDEFIKRYPKDERGANLLGSITQLMTDKAKKAAIEQRIEQDYPDSRQAMMMAAERRQSEAVGKPFAIDFVDATKGSQVNSASLKGKVVVVDFWATWCGPCIAEMPNMKALYAKYKDQGVEFVGVSLDQPRDAGGYDQLKEYVEKNKIEWPQYYQGNGWDSDFSKGWGINSIPAVFAIDADGNLATTEARGKLEELIPELLAKAKDKKGAAAKP